MAKPARTIWKYDIHDALKVPDGTVTLPVPVSARFWHVAVQHGRITVWLEVSMGEPSEYARFRVVGTGHEFQTEGFHYGGTVHLEGYVWHVYVSAALSY